jgi:hypothetical protein
VLEEAEPDEVSGCAWFSCTMAVLLTQQAINQPSGQPIPCQYAVVVGDDDDGVSLDRCVNQSYEIVPHVIPVPLSPEMTGRSNCQSP